jgi:hypothetical protein
MTSDWLIVGETAMRKRLSFDDREQENSRAFKPTRNEFPRNAKRTKIEERKIQLNSHFTMHTAIDL